ncbi:MAG: ATP-grasp domain-containing protein [Treponema sp.]|nr:ATP-grasp domain-containing protein [Treponema sp.]MCL2250374.1 ATP-grasp domain-containing protein [Treponema sp.]
MNILLGSCGGLTGIYLAKQYKNKHYVAGFDKNENNAGKYFLNNFFTVPGVNEKHFIDSIIEIINKLKIDVYIPLHSHEIAIVSEYKEELEKYLTGKILICDTKIITLFDNKFNIYKEINKIGLKCPRIIENETMIDKYPLLLKPIISSGSRGIIKIKDIKEYNFFSSYPNHFICDYYDLDEYTVDCFFSNTHVLIGYYIRKRIKNIGGAVIITEAAMEIDISKELKLIEDNYSLTGPVNFQFFYHNGEIIFFDFNLRFASGGIPLSVHAGLNIPELLLNESVGIPYSKNIQINLSKITMYRYFEELFN